MILAQIVASTKITRITANKALPERQRSFFPRMGDLMVGYYPSSGGGVGEGVGVGDGVGLREGVGEGVGDGVGVGEREGVGEGVGLGDGVAEGVGV